jgi:hypothetical protein
MAAQGVRDPQALHDPADRNIARLDQEEQVNGHQAAAVEREWPAFLLVANRLEECLEVGVIAEHRSAVVAAMDDMVDQSVIDRAQWPWHPTNLFEGSGDVKEFVLTPFT